MCMGARGALVATAAGCVDTGIARLPVAFAGLMAAIRRAAAAWASGFAAPRRGMAFVVDVAGRGHRDHLSYVVAAPCRTAPFKIQLHPGGRGYGLQTGLLAADSGAVALR